MLAGHKKKVLRFSTKDDYGFVKASKGGLVKAVSNKKKRRSH